ncbi:MAG: hypothetical protein AABX47_04860 [Nanoarchaeota archaeon]
MGDEDSLDDKSLIAGYGGRGSLIPFDGSLPQGMEALRQAKVYEQKSLEKLAAHLDECEWFFQKAASYLRPLFNDGLPALRCRVSNNKDTSIDFLIYQKGPDGWFYRILHSSYLNPHEGDIGFWMGEGLPNSETMYGLLTSPSNPLHNVIFSRDKGDGQEDILVKVDRLMTWQQYSQRMIHDYQVDTHESWKVIKLIKQITMLGNSLPGLVERYKRGYESEDKMLEGLKGPSLDV